MWKRNQGRAQRRARAPPDASRAHAPAPSAAHGARRKRRRSGGPAACAGRRVCAAVAAATTQRPPPPPASPATALAPRRCPGRAGVPMTSDRWRPRAISCQRRSLGARGCAGWHATCAHAALERLLSSGFTVPAGAAARLGTPTWRRNSPVAAASGGRAPCAPRACAPAATGPAARARAGAAGLRSRGSPRSSRPRRPPAAARRLRAARRRGRAGTARPTGAQPAPPARSPPTAPGRRPSSWPASPRMAARTRARRSASGRIWCVWVPQAASALR